MPSHSAPRQGKADNLSGKHIDHHPNKRPGQYLLENRTNMKKKPLSPSFTDLQGLFWLRRTDYIQQYKVFFQVNINYAHLVKKSWKHATDLQRKRNQMNVARAPGTDLALQRERWSESTLLGEELSRVNDWLSYKPKQKKGNGF